MPSTEMVMHCEVRYTDKQKMTIYTIINGGNDNHEAMKHDTSDPISNH
jgi:hypothetical protein